MRPASAFLCSLFVLLLSGTAGAEIVTCLPVQCGEDEREDAGGPCLQETQFHAGTVSSGLHLKIGGEAAGCNSEWATSLEFDLGSVPPAGALVAATLVVRKTGYSDDSEGFTYIGAFGYPATGAAVAIERSLLTPETALAIVYPSAANVDLSFDVTAAVQDLRAGGDPRAGFLLAGVYSEVGYETWISVGGAGYPAPPRLVLDFERPIASIGTTWTTVRRPYR